MKKTVFTLCVDGYPKEITDLTFPLLQGYADKIGAEFVIIQKRRFFEWPVVYEKFQIYDLSRELGSDWNIYVDADALVHPDMPDVTAHLGRDTVMQNGQDLASSRWKYDEYMRRDGRLISSCNWFCVFSDWCRDIYHPLEDMTLAQALMNIYPCQLERNFGIDAGHLIDDYVVTRNIARYGLKHTTFMKVWQGLGLPFGYLWHDYLKTNEEKLAEIKHTLVGWKVKPEPELKLVSTRII